MALGKLPKRNVITLPPNLNPHMYHPVGTKVNVFLWSGIHKNHTVIGYHVYRDKVLLCVSSEGGRVFHANMGECTVM